MSRIVIVILIYHTHKPVDLSKKYTSAPHGTSLHVLLFLYMRYVYIKHMCVLLRQLCVIHTTDNDKM
jgi:hypothetical protein